MMNLRMFNKDDMRAYIRVKVEDRVMNDANHEIQREILRVNDIFSLDNMIFVRLEPSRVARYRNNVVNRTKEELKQIE